MNEEIEQDLETNTDAEIESSSETPSEEGSKVEAVEAVSEEQPETKEQVPFHEHPRFKELVEQKNQYASQAKSLEDRYAALQAQLNQLNQPKTPAQAEKDALIEDLRQVDPRLAERLEKFGKTAQSIEQLQAKLQAFENQQAQTSQQQVVQQAVAQINSLHEQNKVSPEMRVFIQNEIDRRYSQGQLKNLDQVAPTYKEVFDQYNKFVEGIKRAERESYVAAKKVDSKIPTSQPKGQPARQGQQAPKWSKDPEVAKQQIVQRYMKQQKAESEI